MIHRGEIVEKVVRRSGYSLTKLAEKLDVTRNTLYNKFKRADLDYWFIVQIGTALHYDFTLDLPELGKETDFLGQSTVTSLGEGSGPTNLQRLEGKYRNLLERYIRLLQLLVKVTYENEFYPLKREVIQLMEEEILDNKP